ncbi:MAG: extracellular solute-binding protein [Chloroflexi bacterium]|nr:extracellular solute-binding protein [Chloroflexota bacterium]
MKKSCLLTLMVLITISTACSRPATSPEAGSTRAAAPGAVTRPAWEQDWEKTLAEGRSEGRVLLLSSFAEARDTVGAAFKEKFGIEVEVVVGRDKEISAKVLNERRAGLYLPDIYLSGTSSIASFNELGPDFLVPMKPFLALPEVLDPKVWMDGGPKFVDPEGKVMSYLVGASAPMSINTDMVRTDEIKSYRDLLDRKWKGKIVVMDPSVGGAGTAFFFIVWELMGPDFVADLGNQDLAITTDARLQVEWLARGKYQISGAISSDVYTQFLQAGAPIRVIVPAEGTSITTGKGGVAILNRAPHPNAAKVLINWLLTKEGQTVMSRVANLSSRRVDVSTEWVEPYKLIVPGKQYIDGESAAALAKKAEMQKISKDVWNIKK